MESCLRVCCVWAGRRCIHCAQNKCCTLRWFAVLASVRLPAALQRCPSHHPSAGPLSFTIGIVTFSRKEEKQTLRSPALCWFIWFAFVSHLSYHPVNLCSLGRMMLADGLDSKPQKQPWICGDEEMFHWAVPLPKDICLAQSQGRPLPRCSYMAKFLAELLGCTLPDKGSSSVYEVGGWSDVVRPVFTVISFFLRCLWSVAFLCIFRLDINYWQLITGTFPLQKSSYAVE